MQVAHDWVDERFGRAADDGSSKVLCMRSFKFGRCPHTHATIVYADREHMGLTNSDPMPLPPKSSLCFAAEACAVQSLVRKQTPPLCSKGQPFAETFVPDCLVKLSTIVSDQLHLVLGISSSTCNSAANCTVALLLTR